MREKFFIKKNLKEIEPSKYTEKAKLSEYEADYRQTILDLGRSYFYINGVKCSIAFASSLEEAKKQILISLDKISHFSIGSKDALVHFILSTLNLNRFLGDISNIISDSKESCLAAYRKNENTELTLSTSLGKCLFYLQIDNEAKPLALHELRVLILESFNGPCIPLEFFTVINFNDPNGNTSLFREGKFKISDQRFYMAKENEMLLDIIEFNTSVTATKKLVAP